MSVYVDKAFIPYRRMIMCHMFADTLKELHDMASKIKVKRKWFQDHDVPHYDICKQMRTHALKLGAIEISRREVGLIIKKHRH